VKSGVVIGALDRLNVTTRRKNLLLTRSVLENRASTPPKNIKKKKNLDASAYFGPGSGSQFEG
jgi:hypothetical protein